VIFLPQGNRPRISTAADARVQPGVEQVHHQVDEHENRDHDQRLGHFVVLIENRYERQPGETIEEVGAPFGAPTHQVELKPYLPCEAVCSCERAPLMLKLDGFCLGGKSLKDPRNSATKVCAGTNTNIRSAAHLSYS